MDCRRPGDIEAVLSDDPRVNPDIIRSFRFCAITEIARRYRRRNANTFRDWLVREGNTTPLPR